MLEVEDGNEWWMQWRIRNRGWGEPIAYLTSISSETNIIAAILLWKHR
jgi:hypothetical protein